MAEKEIFAPNGAGTKIVDNVTGKTSLYTNLRFSELTQTRGCDVLGFNINVDDFVWYIDSYNEPLKIGQVISKTKTLVRLRSFVSGIKQYERSVPRYRVHKFDPDYLNSLTQTHDGFKLPVSQDPVTDIAGNVLAIGDPVILSNREEKGFIIGVVTELKSAITIRVKTIRSSSTHSNWEDKLPCFSWATDQQAYLNTAPSHSTQLNCENNIGRSTNILKITALPREDINTLKGLPHLLILAKLLNSVVDENFRGSEDHVFEITTVFNSAKEIPAYVQKGFDINIVAGGIEHFAHIEAKSPYR